MWSEVECGGCGSQAKAQPVGKEAKKLARLEKRKALKEERAEQHALKIGSKIDKGAGSAYRNSASDSAGACRNPTQPEEGD